MRTLLVCLVVLFAGAAHADWVVLKSGERIATKGGWKERGRNVVFTKLEDSKLVSMPTEEVDLGASLKASANESSARALYKDMGQAPDANHVPVPPEVNQMLAWIEDPTAPRVSGTMSAPSLKVSLDDLVKEGMQILEDPEAAAAALIGEYEMAADRYRNCQSLATDAVQRQACESALNVSVTALNEQVEVASAAVHAAQVKLAEGAETERELDRATEKARREIEAEPEKAAAKKEPRKVVVEVTIPEEGEAAKKETQDQVEKSEGAAEETPPPHR